MSRPTIPISGVHPAPHRPHPLSPGRRGAGQGRRPPASAASGTLDAPESSGIIIGTMGDLRVLRSITPTAVIFTLNQDSVARRPPGRRRLLRHVVQLRADSLGAPGDRAMEAGVSDHAWSAEEIAWLVE
jgi:hypothetical protein